MKNVGKNQQVDKQFDEDPEPPETTSDRTPAVAQEADKEDEPTQTTPVLPPETAKEDPFDPRRFKVAQNYAAMVGGNKIITRVPVGRPHPQVWIRVNPDPAFTIDVNVLELKNENETYIVEPQVARVVPEEVVLKRLFVYVTPQGDLGIWAIKLPDAEGKLDTWNESALVAAQVAMNDWVRIVSNRRIGCYEIKTATSMAAQVPDFGDKSLRDLLAIAFRGKVIDSIAHPILTTLRG